MKFLIIFACLFAVAVANQGKAELQLSTNIEVPHDQDVEDWYYRTYYGHYYNPYGYGNGYYRGRRSVEEKNVEAWTNVKADSADQNTNQWYNRGYYGRHNPYSGYGNRRGRRASKDQSAEESYYPGWGYNRRNYGSHPYRPSYYYIPNPASFGYAYSH